MNSQDTTFASCAAEADRKRAAAKKLIERYYFQLTEGCGNSQCSNDNCASNCHIAKLKPNQAAAAALRLFKAKSKLCVLSQAGVETSSSSNLFDSTSATACMGDIASGAAGSMSLSELSSPSEENCSMDISNSPSSNNISSGKADNFLVLSRTTPSKTIALDNSESTHSFRNSGASNPPDVINSLSDSKFHNPQSVSTSVDKVISTTAASIPLAEIPSPSEENCSMDVSTNNDLNQGREESFSHLSPVVPCNSNSKTANVEPSSSTTTSSFGVSFLDEESLLTIIEECKTKQSFSLLIRTLGQIFSSEESLQLSFTKNLTSKGLCKEDIRAMEIDEDKDKDCKEDAANSAMCAAAKNGDITVDVESVRRSFRALFSIPDHPFQRALINALIILSENLEFDFKYGTKNLMDGSILNIFVVVMEIPMLECPEYMETAFPAFCKAASLLPVSGQAKLARMWSTFGPVRLKEMVDTLHQFITLKVITGNYTRDYCINDEETIVAATKLMKILFFANMVGGDMDDELLIIEENEQNEADDNFQDLLQGASGLDSKEPKPAKEDLLGQELGVKPINCRDPVMSFEEFYNEPLSEQLEMDRDFAYYKTEGGKFSFMNYSFILTPAVKALGLYYDNRIRMYSERRISVLHSLVHGAPPNPYLRLRVRRDHIIDDALVGLEMVAMENPNNLKKQLVVEFEGEQGIDEGGVSKEFFQLVVDEVFNPDFAMFTLNPDTQTYWFNPTSFESDAQFTLIGIILGLAIYNNIILDVHFPMVVYRKLMGKKGTFHDLQDWNPVLSKGLQDLLSYEGEDIETVFMQTFRITYQDVFGTVLIHDLKENGDQILVNQVSKEEFVQLYAGFLLNKSIEKQFNAFRRGFQMVTDDSPLKMLFRPEEVELLVCGSRNFDFNALEEATEYDGGYLSDTMIIRWFWELVHDFSLDQKRKLLQFTTGSDRVPVGGLSKLKLVIARHGPDSDRLPTAHTCFNVLLLPEYSSKEKLEERLLKAINYSKGFGML